jgi:hypothetical protein
MPCECGILQLTRRTEARLQNRRGAFVLVDGLGMPEPRLGRRHRVRVRACGAGDPAGAKSIGTASDGASGARFPKSSWRRDRPHIDAPLASIPASSSPVALSARAA